MIRLNPKYIPLLATAAVLILVFGTGSFLYPNFGTPRVIVNLLNDMAFVGVAAVGESFVILSGGIDLSVGSMVAFIGILIARLLQAGCDPFLAIGIAHPFYPEVLPQLSILVAPKAVLPFTAMCFLGSVIIGTFVAGFTRFGRYVYAIGSVEKTPPLLERTIT